MLKNFWFERVRKNPKRLKFYLIFWERKKLLAFVIKTFLFFFSKFLFQVSKKCWDLDKKLPKFQKEKMTKSQKLINTYQKWFRQNSFNLWFELFFAKKLSCLCAMKLTQTLSIWWHESRDINLIYLFFQLEIFKPKE